MVIFSFHVLFFLIVIHEHLLDIFKKTQHFCSSIFDPVTLLSRFSRWSLYTDTWRIVLGRETCTLYESKRHTATSKVKAKVKNKKKREPNIPTLKLLSQKHLIFIYSNTYTHQEREKTTQTDTHSNCPLSSSIFMKAVANIRQFFFSKFFPFYSSLSDTHNHSRIQATVDFAQLLNTQCCVWACGYIHTGKKDRHFNKRHTTTTKLLSTKINSYFKHVLRIKNNRQWWTYSDSQVSDWYMK